MQYQAATPSTDAILPARTVRTRFGNISSMTVHRWIAARILPEPIKINGRNYWREADIVALQAGRAATGKGGAQ